MAFNGVVPAPLVEPAPFGLLSAANVVEYEDRDDPHWLQKMDVETDACYFNVDLYDICDPSHHVSILDQTTGARSHVVHPFAITAVDKCSTFGYSAIDREQRVLKQLELATQKAVEREFWGGELTEDVNPTVLNRYLTWNDMGGVTTVGGGALSPSRALAVLEQALADCGAGARGMIHAPRRAASLLIDQLVVETVGTGEYAKQRLNTKLGTIVSAGVGYTGTAPGNTAATANHQWMYATGQVTVYLGPKAVVGETPATWVDETVNDMTLQADRGAAVVWDGCCHFAVEVDLTA